MNFISLKCYGSFFLAIAFFIIGLFCLLTKYYSAENDNEFLKADQYVILFTYCISDLLSGFLIIITQRLTQSHSTQGNEKEENLLNPFELINFDKNDKKSRKKKYFLIFLICLIDFLGRAASLIYYFIFDDNSLSLESKNTWLIIMDLIFRILFSKWILQEKIYKHHLMSLFFLIIGYISMIYSGIYLLNHSKVGKWYYIIFSILRRLAFSIGDTLTKKLFAEEFILPQILMFYKGIFALIIHCLVFFPIIAFSETIPFSENNNYFFIDNDSFEKIMKILFIIFLFIRNVIILQIIYVFSAIHIGFFDSVIKYCDYIMKVIFSGLDKSDLPEPKFLMFIINLISLILIIFGTLLFSEIIIINKWGLDYDTKSALYDRIILDRLSIDSQNMVLPREDEDDTFS